MELNAVKQIITTNKTLFDQTIEQAIDTDFTLPDYCPNIERILKCKVTPRLNSKSVSGDSLTIDGTAVITLIYTDGSGIISSHEHEAKFQKIIPLGDTPINDGVIIVNLNNDYMNCRAVTSRKMDIHGVICISVKIEGTSRHEILCDIDCDGMQLKSDNCPATNPLGIAEKTVIIEEELELSPSNTNISSVLRHEVRPIISECKMVGNKAVISGDLIICALYCASDNQVQKYENRVPFNQILEIDIEGTECNCEAKMMVMSSSLKPRVNLSGESNSFYFECKLCLIATASCDNEVSLLYDAFCTKAAIDIQQDTLSLKRIEKCVNERYMCKKTLEFSENSFGSVVDLWCENKLGQVKIVSGKLHLNGTVTVCIISIDTSGQPQYYERGIDFEYEHNLELDKTNLVPMVDITSVSSAFTIIGDAKIEARIELTINGAIYSVTTKNVIIGANITENEKPTPKKAPIVVYFAQAGEDVWDISKRYNSSCTDVLEINELESDIIKTPTLLIMP